MESLFRQSKANLLAGLSLVLWRRCDLSHFHTSLDQALVLLGLNLMLTVAADFVAAGPTAKINPYALPLYIFGAAAIFFAAFVMGKVSREPARAVSFPVLCYSAAPLPSLLGAVIVSNDNVARASLDPTAAAFALYVVWTLAILLRVLFIVAGRRIRPALLALGIVLPIVHFPAWFYREDARFWYAEEETVEEADLYAPYRAVDAERLIYDQKALLDAALEGLRPQREGAVDLYFVGFAGYAYEDAFRKEVEYTRDLFDERFGTRGRSVVLVNHLATRDRWPLASVTNLAAALKHIGRLMNSDEDVLFLYLTSHGSADHELAVDFWPLPLNGLTPGALVEMLAEAKIKWRVVLVSACYSGGFVTPLEDPFTLVATAAAADRTSFGCGNAFDFTYFGEALVKDQLGHDFSIIRAIGRAADAIASREEAEQLQQSMPQVSVGIEMADKLWGLEANLARDYCSKARLDAPGC